MRKRFIMQAVIAIVFGTTLFGSAVAQGQEASAGITVIGYGQASAPADTATIQFVVGDEYYGQPTPPEPDATPGAREREAVAPVVASLTDAGVPEGDIELIVAPFVSELYGFGGPAMALIRVSLPDPSTERIVEIVNAATVGAAQERLLIGSIGAAFGSDDCAALEREARAGAIADAREQADIQAELLEVPAGEVVASRDIPADHGGAEFGFYGPIASGGGCAPEQGASTFTGIYDQAPFDPTTEPEVTAYAQVELTFAMTSGLEATPAA